MPKGRLGTNFDGLEEAVAKSQAVKSDEYGLIVYRYWKDRFEYWGPFKKDCYVTFTWCSDIERIFYQVIDCETDVYERVLAKELKPFVAIKELGMSTQTYYRYRKEYESKLSVG